MLLRQNKPDDTSSIEQTSIILLLKQLDNFSMYLAQDHILELFKVAKIVNAVILVVLTAYYLSWLYSLLSLTSS